MRGPLCKVCTSPIRSQIDADMLGGMSLRQVSHKYGYTRSTLHNHRIKCQGIPVSKIRPLPHTPESDALSRQKRKELAAPSRLAAIEAMLPTREELSSKLEECIVRINNIVIKNEATDGVDTIALKGLSEMRATVADLARLAGHIGNGSAPAVNVGVLVNMSACEIGAALAKHLANADPSLLIEAIADEH